MVKYERNGHAGHPVYSGSEPDGALAALLRCVVYQLGADVAMVSLLDEHTQYFVSGASRSNAQDAKVTLESTQWYGCESVVHHGGLCERTIAQEGLPGCMAFYEELDMTKTERTQNLSFVNGDTAKFRYYAGVPLSPYGGANIGTVFFFSEKPSEPDRSAANRSYLTEIAKHITRHLEQAVEALQGQRVLRFNNGVASLLEIGSDTALASGTASLSLESPRGKQPRLVLDQHSDSVLRVYQLAAILLYDIFEFDGVQIHEVGASRNHANSPCREGSRVIAQHLGPNTPRLEEPSQALLDKLLELFPRGAVFQVAPDFGEVVAATGADNVAIVADDIVSAGLPKAFPNAGQIILMPLWDTHHECNIGAILGFACDQSRVYLGSNDLTSMSAFCMTIMTQVRRLEAKAMDKVKSDFLGSVSHEMRTPLHGILSCLELFADTISSDHQRELLQTAQYSGMSLLETIDRVLYLSNINSEGQSAKESFSKEPEGWRPHQPSPMHHGPEIPPIEKETLPIIQVCERVLDRAAQKLRLRETLRPDLFRHHRSTNSRRSSHGTPPSLIIVFDTNATWSCSLTAVTSFERVFTNLLDNAIKFGDSIGCIRVELAIDEISVKLSITDTGKGVAPDFVRHSIFDVFSQEDPATEGAGLGLSIAKQTVSTLGGNILIDTDQAWGSSFNVTLPLSSVLSEMSHEMPGPQSNFLGSSLINLPQLTMTLFLPRRWDMDNIRGRRCTEMILESLTRDLRRWFQIDVALWETPSRHPRLFVVLSEDLDHAIHTCGHALDQTKLIVLCPKYEAAPSVHRTPSLDTAVIVGPVTVSKLQDALVCLFPGTVTHSGIGPSLDQMSDIAEYHVISTRSREGSPAKPADTVNNDLLSQSLSNMKLQEEKEEHGVWELIPATALPDTRSPELLESATRDALEMRQTINNDTSPQSTAARDPSLLVPLVNMKEPKLVLVDDNTINLKVLGMFARKCSRSASKSVNGGQEALDAYNEALTSDSDTSQPYDIMFLDLSMPEVSGFEVAAKIRETEASLKCTSHLYICALTGLASAKDRNRAYASGVDDYLVKPAGLKDIQAVINRWRDVCSNRQQQMC